MESTEEMPLVTPGVKRVYSAAQFDVREELGHGAYGNVYRGIDKVTNTEVAIKQIDLESDENILEFKREIALLSTCNNEFITKYYGCFVRGFKLWIIMEYLPGGSLTDLLTPGPLKESYISKICYDMVQGLDYLHENGKIHRDLKPANILVSKDGTAKIADFGVSTQLSNKLSLRNTYIGTPYYMAPEVILHHQYNFKADIWSLGITLLELANGRPPLYQYHPMQAVYLIEKNEPPALVGDEFSNSFKDFINLCLQRDPNKRPTTKQLMKHKFLTSRRSSSDKILSLVERKREWDERNGDGKIQQKKFYVPTVESASTASTTSEDTTEFDFDFESLGNQSESTIKGPKETFALAKGQVDLSEDMDMDYDRMSHELNAMLNLSFNKISSKLNLSTYQYDNLVTFKTNFLNDAVRDEDKKNRDIFLIFFKNFMKRLYNSDVQPLKQQLLPRIILENQKELMELKHKQNEQLKLDNTQVKLAPATRDGDRKRERERDHIEELLLSRWAEGMIEKWTN